MAYRPDGGVFIPPSAINFTVLNSSVELTQEIPVLQHYTLMEDGVNIDLILGSLPGLLRGNYRVKKVDTVTG